jgi:DNA-binding response OmpR family regulator
MQTKAFECATPRRLLYVEEHEESRQMLVCMLKNAGYAMSTATSIADGLNLVEREQFDLYILGSGYTDGSGVDLCRQLHAFDPLTPIMFFSGEAYPSDIAAGLAAGAQQYLTKPMGIYTITQTNAELLPEEKNARVEVLRAPSRQQENEAHNLSYI